MLKKESVLWVSHKQKSVTISTTKTEYIIIFICVKTDIWFTQMLWDMNLERYLEDNLHCVNIHENKIYKHDSSLQFKKDNQTALILVKNAYMYERSKHIDIVYHYICDLHLKNKIKIFFVFSADIIVNELIKSLSKQMFKHFVCQLKLDNSES